MPQKTKSKSIFSSLSIKDFPGASNFLPFSSSLHTTNNQSTIPSISNQSQHSALFGGPKSATQFNSVHDYGKDKSILDDYNKFSILDSPKPKETSIFDSDFGFSKKDSFGLDAIKTNLELPLTIEVADNLATTDVAIPQATVNLSGIPNVQTAAEDHDVIVQEHHVSPTNSPIINRRRDRRALKRFRETSRNSRALPSYGCVGYTDACEYIYTHFDVL